MSFQWLEGALPRVNKYVIWECDILCPIFPTLFLYELYHKMNFSCSHTHPLSKMVLTIKNLTQLYFIKTGLLIDKKMISMDSLMRSFVKECLNTFSQTIICYVKVCHPFYSTSMECRPITCQVICWALGTPIWNTFADRRELKACEGDR